MAHHHNRPGAAADRSSTWAGQDTVGALAAALEEVDLRKNPDCMARRTHTAVDHAAVDHVAVGHVAAGRKEAVADGAVGEGRRHSRAASLARRTGAGAGWTTRRAAAQGW